MNRRTALSTLALPLGVILASPALRAEPSKDAAPPKKDATPGEFIKVSKKGARIDPPVSVAEIPPGAWMCKMRTVHFAALEKGDGKCPLCKMKLVQKSSTT